MKKRNKHIGSSLDDFPKEEGVLEETRAVTLGSSRCRPALGRCLSAD
jgi:hypothetical protein